MSTNNVLIGKRIRASRERLGMNQSELARKAGVTPSYLNRAEIGAFQAPSVEKLTSIATALGVKLADLTGESEPLDEDVAAQLERLDPAAPPTWPRGWTRRSSGRPGAGRRSRSGRPGPKTVHRTEIRCLFRCLSDG